MENNEVSKLNNRSAHVFHALKGAAVKRNRFTLVNLAAKGSRALWTREKVQSENINKVMRVIGKGEGYGKSRNRIGSLVSEPAGVSCPMGSGGGQWEGGRG